MSLIGTKLFTWWKGELVGTDAFGNRYFRAKDGSRKRWVIYKGKPEASKVPPEWHAWLHRTTVAPPTGQSARRPWQKEHQPNLTGTLAAYRPPGSLLRGGRRPHATGDYEAWKPE